MTDDDYHNTLLPFTLRSIHIKMKLPQLLRERTGQLNTSSPMCYTLVIMYQKALAHAIKNFRVVTKTKCFQSMNMQIHTVYIYTIQAFFSAPKFNPYIFLTVIRSEEL